MKFINQLPSKDRKDILKFYDDLRYYNKHNHSAFMKKVNKTLEVIANIATVGLAGASLYDLFIDPEFFNSINQKIYSKDSSLATTRNMAEKSEFFASKVNEEPIKSNVNSDGSYEGMLDTLFLNEGENILNGSIDISNMSHEEIYKYISAIHRAPGLDNKEQIIDNMLSGLDNNSLVGFVEYYNKVHSGETPILSSYNLNTAPIYASDNIYHKHVGITLNEVMKQRQLNVSDSSMGDKMLSSIVNTNDNLSGINDMFIGKVGVIDLAAIANSIVDAKAKFNEITDKKNIESFGMKK